MGKVLNKLNNVISRINPITKTRRFFRKAAGYQPEVTQTTSSFDRALLGGFHSAKDKAYNRIVKYSELDGQPIESYLPEFVYWFVRRLNVRLGSSLRLYQLYKHVAKRSRAVQPAQRAVRQAYGVLMYKYGSTATIGQILNMLRTDRAKARREAGHCEDCPEKGTCEKNTKAQVELAINQAQPLVVTSAE